MRKGISKIQVAFNKSRLFQCRKTLLLLELNGLCNRRVIKLQFETKYVRQYADNKITF